MSFSTLQKDLVLERLKEKGLAEWLIEEVLSWLDAIGYGHYANNFKEQRISGVVLKTLTVQSLLDEIKIPPYGDRVQIKNLIDVFLEFERERERERTGPVLSNEGRGGGGGVGGASITNVNRALTSLEEDQSILIDHEELVFYEVLGRGKPFSSLLFSSLSFLSLSLSPSPSLISVLLSSFLHAHVLFLTRLFQETLGRLEELPGKDQTLQ
jgi:hypothetical protein